MTQQLITCLVTIKQKIKTIGSVIRASVAYCSYAAPYSMPTIRKFDKKMTTLHKKIYGLHNCTPNIATQLPQDLCRMEALFF